MPITGEELYGLAVSGELVQRKIEAVLLLKTHVKKENVDLLQVEYYFNAIGVLTEGQDLLLQNFLFSLLCHLVKRVLIQDHRLRLLPDNAYLVLPIIIPRIADLRLLVKISAKRALEAYWLSAPRQVEAAVLDTGLCHRAPLVINECVVWLNYVLTEIDHHFSLASFLPLLVGILVSHEANRALVGNVVTLLANYYDLKHNRGSRLDLLTLLNMHNVLGPIRSQLGMLAPTVHAPAAPTPNPVSPQSPTLNSADLLHSLPNYPLDLKVHPMECPDPDYLYQSVGAMGAVFEGKETERNWSAREKHIVTLRALLRGNAHTDFPTELVLCLKGLAEGLCKALVSLRTTLSVKLCQFVKECALLLHTHFDPLFELFTPTLIKLCSATKHLTSSNAHVAVSAIMGHCSYGAKILHKIQSASADKSSSTRTCCAFWLQLYIVRSDENGGMLNQEIVERILIRLLSDPNSSVRQAAKNTFWAFQSFAPEAVDTLTLRLEPNVVKALERSKPPSANPSRAGSVRALSRPSSRPSIKESIMAKNREIRAKLRESSRLSSRNGIPAEPPRRTASKSSLPRPPSRNDLSRSGRSTPTAIPTLSRQALLSRTVKLPPPEKTFVKASDPIFLFLSSSSETTIREGVSLLRYAMLVDEKFPLELGELLRKVSVSHPDCLRPLFCAGSTVYEKTAVFFTQEDLLRTSCVLFDESPLLIEKILAVMAPHNRIPAASHVLSCIGDLDTIRGDQQLIMHFIKYKKKFLSMVLKFVYNCVVSGVEQADFELLCSQMFDMIAVVRFTSSLDDYTSVVKQLYAANTQHFLAQLEKAPENNKTEISSILGLAGPKPEPEAFDEVRQLTQIPQENIGKPVSPLKKPSDLTMLVPQAGADSNYTFVDSKPPHLGQIGKLDLATIPSLDAEPVYDSIIDDDVNMDRDEDHEGDHIDREDGHMGENGNIDQENGHAGHENGHVATHEIHPGNGQHLIENEAHMDVENRDIEERPKENGHSEQSTENSQSPSTQKSDQLEHKNDLDSDMFEEEKSTENTSHPNIFNNENQVKNEFLARLNSDPSSELVEDFAQVKITNRLNCIQSFIDKVDPLSKISSKNRPISIFEDAKVTGSPQKVKEYSYTELNWFNFLVANIALDTEGPFEDYTVEEFKSLCDSVANGDLSGQKSICLLRYLQNEQSQQFDDFFASEGLHKIERSLFSYLASPENQDKLSGLILVKQLLINREAVSVQGLWNTLLRLSEELPLNSCELAIAVGETFDEALCGLYSSSDLLHIVVKSLRELHKDSNIFALSFATGALYKLVCSKTMALVVSEELVAQLHDVLVGFLNHAEVQIRKNVVQTYGRLVRAARVSELSATNKAATAGKCGVVEDIMSSFSGPQRKMIEYYSH